MRQMEAPLTQKGQVTIPQAIRARLGLKPKDKIRFEVEGETVTIGRAPSRIARHFGAVSVLQDALSGADEREAFEAGVAEEVAAEAR